MQNTAILFSTQTGTTPLIQAITCNYVQIAETILGYNADVNKADNVIIKFINQLVWSWPSYIIQCPNRVLE